MFECERRKCFKILKQFVEQIEEMKIKNYELKSAKVNFIVYWKKEETEKEVKIILPEIYFKRLIDNKLEYKQND